MSGGQVYRDGGRVNHESLSGRVNNVSHVGGRVNNVNHGGGRVNVNHVGGQSTCYYNRAHIVFCTIIILIKGHFSVEWSFRYSFLQNIPTYV